MKKERNTEKGQEMTRKREERKGGNSALAYFSFYAKKWEKDEKTKENSIKSRSK